MRNAAVIMVTLYVSLLAASVFSVNYESAAKTPAEDIALSNNDYFNIEKQYLHTNEMAYSIAVQTPELTLSPTPAPSLTPDPPSPTLPPEPTLSPRPTPSPSPKPTSSPKPTPIPTLSPKPEITLSAEQAASMTPDELELATFAIKILNHPGITLATIHPSGVVDSAFAYNNIYDTSLGHEAKRSRYGTAPGGSVYLNSKMLNAMLLLAEKYNFTITEIAGANHSSGSTHYSGIAFDVGTINGKYATNGATARAFVADAKKCGATYTLIESTCVHIDFR